MTKAAQKPIAIIAGNGTLPLEVAERLIGKGERIFLVGIEGEASDKISQYSHMFMEWGQIGKLFKSLKEVNARSVLLAGGIVRRPDISLRKLDWGTVRTLPEVLGVMLSGDNTVLASVIEIFERRGFPVASMASLLPELLVRPGANGGCKPRKRDVSRLEDGLEVVRELGRFDIGQGAVIVGDRAVAIEAVEGTDAMLERVAQLRRIGRLPAKRGGVLVKGLKPKQDERADLPTIGPKTISNIHAAGLNGVGLEAGKTLIVEREETLRLADQLGVFVYGLSDGGGTRDG